MKTAEKAYATGRRRPDGDPSESAARKISLLVELLRDGRARYTDYLKLHERDYRSFQRDLQQLRQMGQNLGFTISKIEEGETVKLESYDRKLRKLDDQRPALLQLISEFARAYGEPMQRELGAIGTTPPAGEPFFHLHAPRLIEGSYVAKVYEALKGAWLATGGRTYVRFRYKTARVTAPAERTVDPHRVVVRHGRYYLIGFDVDRKSWRVFALDAFLTIPARAGTVSGTRTVPADYDSDDVLGFIKATTAPIPITVEFSASLAAAMACRLWQREQTLKVLPDGRAKLTVNVSDIDEAVRWVLGFAPDAKITAPPQAVRRAKSIALAIAANH